MQPPDVRKGALVGALRDSALAGQGIDAAEDIPSHGGNQARVARRIALRFAISPEHAAVVAELAGIGGGK